MKTEKSPTRKITRSYTELGNMKVTTFYDGIEKPQTVQYLRIKKGNPVEFVFIDTNDTSKKIIIKF